MGKLKYTCDRYKGNKTIYYLNDVMSLDTETSKSNDITWLSSIQVYFNKAYFLFRTPTEFLRYMEHVIEMYGLNYNHRLMIIIHNASYDLSYLLGYIQKYLPDKDDRSVIMRSKHNIVSYRQGGLDFRDTYALCNKSLEKWGKDLNVTHQKKIGLYDYEKVIFQDSILTEQEKEYDKFDVISLYECFHKQLEIYGDTINTVPYTSTGYVRRECFKICRKDKYFRNNYFINNRLNFEEFTMCINSFSGGYTHNNRFYSNKVVTGLIGHRDFRSEYPSELRCYPLPFGKPRMYYDVTDKLTSKKKLKVDDVLNLYPKYSSVVMIQIREAIIKDKNITMPFLQFSKMKHLKPYNCIKDNGRVLSYIGDCILYVDNLLLKILCDQYKLKVRILKVLTFENTYLPQPLCELIDNYFKGKSDLKIKANHLKETYGEFDPRTVDAMLDLLLSKGGLNGIYGMFVQSPLCDNYDIDYDKEEMIIEELRAHKTKQVQSEMLDEFYKNRRKVLAYQVGCFVTALARFELYEYICAIGYDKVLYCDTDSIFYLKDEETEKRIEQLNKVKHQNAIDRNAFITDSKGNKIFYDVFEQEDDLIAFKGLHAKCYGCITKDKNEFVCTIAGVPSKTLIGMKDDKPIYLTREEELCGITKDIKLSNLDVKVDNMKAIENLTDGFTFYTNTGTTCDYKHYMFNENKYFVIDGHIIETMGGALISKLDSKQIKNIDDYDISTECTTSKEIAYF